MIRASSIGLGTGSCAAEVVNRPAYLGNFVSLPSESTVLVLAFNVFRRGKLRLAAAAKGARMGLNAKVRLREPTRKA